MRSINLKRENSFVILLLLYGCCVYVLIILFWCWLFCFDFCIQVDFNVISHASFNSKNPIKKSGFQYDQFGYASDYVDTE